MVCLENGAFWGRSGSKRVKNAFFQKDLGLCGVAEKDNCAQFEPNLPQFRPSGHMNAPNFKLLVYHGAVLWSHVELGRGV